MAFGNGATSVDTDRKVGVQTPRVTESELVQIYTAEHTGNPISSDLQTMNKIQLYPHNGMLVTQT